MGLEPKIHRPKTRIIQHEQNLAPLMLEFKFEIPGNNRTICGEIIHGNLRPYR